MKSCHRLVAASLLVLITIGTGCGFLGGSPTQRVVRVGLYENAPKVFTSPSGKPAGLFVELLDEIARDEGWKLSYQSCEWSACLEALRAGQLDLMLDVAFSDERAKIFDFHDASVASSWSQVFGNPQHKIYTLDELDGKRVALLKGGIQETFFAKLMAGGGFTYRPIYVHSLDEGYQAVVTGEADAVVTNSFFAARNSSKYKLQETPIVFLPSNLYFATGKGRNAELLDAIDRHLAEWRHSPNSLYFDALHRAMYMQPEALVPKWATWTLASAAGTLILLGALSLVLRKQVEQRTRELTQTTHELEHQRENLEHRVADRTAELQALFDSASTGIVLMRERTILRSNRRADEMFGYALGEQIGQTSRQWYASDADWAANGNTIYSDVWHGQTSVKEMQVVRKDGSPFWARMAARAVDTSDHDKGIVLVIEDITAERAAMEEMSRAKTLAEEATRMKSEFLANMSHEIRTPMNAILGMLYLTLKTELSPTQQNYLTKAQGAAHSLLGIINDILDFSKIEAGKLAIEQIEFGLDTVLEKLTDAIGYQAEHKGIEFLIRYDPSIPATLIGDPLRLGQILLNLCGNAVKFTEHGEIELAFRALNQTDEELTIQVSVRDSGIGMAPEMQTRLFDKFIQADQSTTRRFGGTGLGLAISKSLVEMMNGRIWIEDSQPGNGTTICFTARLAIAQQARQHRQQLVDQVGDQLKGVRVLVVDDNQVSREILAEMLRFFHLEVEVAANGVAALAALRAAGDEPFDLVLMDWRMPGMNGDEVTQRLHRDMAITPHPKVIMITAYGRDDVIRMSEQAGVDGLLIKPVSPSTLLDTLVSTLGRGRILGKGDKSRSHLPTLATAGQLAGARLLLVEDNDINREFAYELLRSEGIEVDEAANGQEAVDKVRAQAYDAVLMDIQMPVMSGLDAARAIRALATSAPDADRERFARLPIIAMTALAMAQDAEKTLAAGMNDHVTKPISPDRLMSVLLKWVHLPKDRHRQPAANAAATPATAALPADLAALTCINAQEGVRRIGGKADIYRRQLRRFREHYADATTTLRDLIGKQEIQHAEEFCHSLKGVAGNISADALYALLIEIDDVLKQGQAPIDASIDAFDTLLQQVLRDIDGLPSDTPHTTAPLAPLTRAELIGLLDQLQQAFEFDLGAVDTLLARLRAGTVGHAEEKAVIELAEKADRFDIDAALLLAGELRQRLKPAHSAN